MVGALCERKPKELKLQIKTEEALQIRRFCSSRARILKLIDFCSARFLGDEHDVVVKDKELYSGKGDAGRSEEEVLSFGT